MQATEPSAPSYPVEVVPKQAIWHLITCEYPPDIGGVSDYSEQIAKRMAESGDVVHVWAPGQRHRTAGSNLRMHSLGTLGLSSLRKAGAELDQMPRPRRLLVQWVPHGYRHRSMNILFCCWIWSRARLHGDSIQLMVHEPFLQFGEGTWRQDVVATVHRVMIRLLLRAANQVWTSIPGWIPQLRPYAESARMQWAPVPSGVAPIYDPAAVTALRSRYAPGGEVLIGHFGTYGGTVCQLLEQCVPAIVAGLPVRLILFGNKSDAFVDRWLTSNPELRDCVYATGSLPAADVSLHLHACDLMIQPYPDGISARRTSAMAALAHGTPVVTTSGHNTEPVWAESGAVSIHPVRNMNAFVESVRHLAQNFMARQQFARAATELYESRFDVAHTIAAIRQAAL